MEPIITYRNYYENLPSGWIKCTLNNIALITMGQSPDGNTYGNIGIEFHQGKSFFGDRILGYSSIKTSSPIKTTTSHSIVMSVRAPVGDINICDRIICIGRGLCAIDYLITELTEYLYILLKANNKYFNDNSTGTTFKAVNHDIVSSLPILLPPFKEQQKIIKKVNQINTYL